MEIAMQSGFPARGTLWYVLACERPVVKSTHTTINISTRTHVHTYTLARYRATDPVSMILEQ